MADITDPAIRQLLNDQIRPMSESARAFKLRLHSLIVDYDQKYALLLVKAEDADVLNDGRDVEGVPFRTVGELREWLAVFRKVVASGADEWPDDLIARFCVRKLEVAGA